MAEEPPCNVTALEVIGVRYLMRGGRVQKQIDVPAERIIEGAKYPVKYYERVLVDHDYDIRIG